jgi:hypothetical protein
MPCTLLTECHSTKLCMQWIMTWHLLLLLLNITSGHALFAWDISIAANST